MPGKDNANKFIVKVEQVPGGGSYVQIAYIISNDLTDEKGLIDVSNKTDGTPRCNIPGGQEFLDISAEGVASDDSTLNLLWTIYESAEQGRNMRVEHQDVNGSIVRSWQAFFHIAN